MDIDKYGRTIGMVFIGGININEALLRGGMAWHYKQYDKNPEWAKIENEARHNRVGLWAEDEPMAPWDYRHAKK